MNSAVETENKMNRPTPLLIPSLADHQGLGILPGDWIKPDPAMTRQETRKYLFAETRQWLTGGRLRAQARDIGIAGLSPMELTGIVSEGRWPAARLWLIQVAMEMGGETRLPADPVERTYWVGGWATDVCERVLQGYEPSGSIETLAAGFVTVDRLPCGRTIASWWNWSPFEALRNAPPLPDGGGDGKEVAETSEAESDGESEELGADEEVVQELPRGIDDRLEEVGDAMTAFFRGTFVVAYGGAAVRIPVWAAAAALMAWIVQLWIVGFLLGRQNRV